MPFYYLLSHDSLLLIFPFIMRILYLCESYISSDKISLAGNSYSDEVVPALCSLLIQGFSNTKQGLGRAVNISPCGETVDSHNGPSH